MLPTWAAISNTRTGVYDLYECLCVKVDFHATLVHLESLPVSGTCLYQSQIGSFKLKVVCLQDLLQKTRSRASMQSKSEYQTSKLHRHKLKQPQSQWNHILKSHHPLLTTKLIFATLVLKSAAAMLTLQNCNFFTNSILHRHSRGYRKKAGTFSADVDLAVGKQTMTQTQQQ